MMKALLFTLALVGCGTARQRIPDYLEETAAAVVDAAVSHAGRNACAWMDAQRSEGWAMAHALLCKSGEPQDALSTTYSGQPGRMNAPGSLHLVVEPICEDLSTRQ